MALESRGLIPKGSTRRSLSELSASPDPADAAYAALRALAGKPPPIQEIAGSGPAPKGKVRLPDMTGWPAREALKTSQELGVVPRLEGTGLLVRQTPPPGTVVEPATPVTLVFEPAS
jgi:hypothetical protein